MKTKLVVAVLATGLLTAAGCGGAGTSTEAGGGSDASAPEPSVSFVAPADGSEQSENFAAGVKLENFRLNPDAVGEAAVEGQGHLHFSLDEGKYDTAEYSGANGELAEQLGVDGQYSPSTEPSIRYTGIPKGEHTLVVYLANNDHSDTGVSASTTFEVK
jgi:hypothetical protein